MRANFAIRITFFIKYLSHFLDPIIAHIVVA